MKRPLLIFLPFFLVIFFGSFYTEKPFAGKTITTNNLITQDSTFDADAAIAKIQEQIKGKENMPAEEVFNNIEIMKGFPAGRVPMIMKMAFNNSLGVSCDHCHNTDSWESDEKIEKKVTRDMWRMVGRINKELLTEIDGLKSEQPAVNCTTCHRGDLKPAMNIK